MKKTLSWFVLWYLRVVAKLQVEKTNPKIIGIAGSSGKTSLVRLVKEMLQDNYRVVSTEGKNSETGIPFAILGIHMRNYRLVDWLQALIRAKWQLLTNWKKYDIFVAEMGIDSPIEPKNMSYLLKIVQPVIGIVTNISFEHSEYFDRFVTANSEKERQEKILAMTASQEILLLTSLPKDAVAIVNIDDPYIQEASEKICAKKLTISLENPNANLYASNISTTFQEFSMRIVWHEKVFQLRVGQMLPRYYAYEFLCALACALTQDVPLPSAIASLEKHFLLPPGRLSIFEGIKKTTIIDSSYNNATLDPILGILDLIKTTKGNRRTLAIIGDMRELGSQSRYAHEVLAQKLARCADEVILIGPLLKNYASEILKREKVPFQSFNTYTQAKSAILQTVREKDIILVKGSQNTLFLERVVEMLLSDKRDVEKLCRRGIYWDEKRAQTK